MHKRLCIYLCICIFMLVRLRFSCLCTHTRIDSYVVSVCVDAWIQGKMQEGRGIDVVVAVNLLGDSSSSPRAMHPPLRQQMSRRDANM